MDEKKKCFVMMPFTTPSGYEEGHFRKVYDQIIKPAIEEAGYDAIRVIEDFTSSSIIEKVFKGLIESEMAVCDLSAKNPNVLYELGIRQAYNKPVVLIKDDKTERIFDVSGITTLEYSSLRLFENVIRDKESLKKAIIENSEKTPKIIDLIKINEASYNGLTDSEDENDIISLQLKTLISEIEDIKKSLSTTKNLNEFIIQEKNDKFEQEFHKAMHYFRNKQFEIIDKNDCKELNSLKDEMMNFRIFVLNEAPNKNKINYLKKIDSLIKENDQVITLIKNNQTINKNS